MKERDYIRLKEQLRREYDEKLRALETVWTMVNKGSLPGSHRAAVKVAGQKGFIRATVRRVSESFASNFGIREVREALNADPETAGKIGDAQISTALARLADREELEVVEKGSGKRASIYRRK